MGVLDIQYTSATSIGHTLPPGIYEISYINLILKSLLAYDVELIITIDDFRLKSNLFTNKTIRFTKNHSSLQY